MALRRKALEGGQAPLFSLALAEAHPLCGCGTSDSTHGGALQTILEVWLEGALPPQYTVRGNGGAGRGKAAALLSGRGRGLIRTIKR